MRRNGTLHRLIYNLLRWTSGVCVLILGVVVGAMEVVRQEVTMWPWLSERIRDAILPYSLLLAPVTAAYAAMALLIAGWMKPTRVRESIQNVLDEVQTGLFAGDTTPHKNRVTLFRYQQLALWPNTPAWWPWGRGRLPWSGWLVPVVRSSYAPRKGMAWFLAPDDAESAEGIVGLAWATGRTRWVHDLPELTVHSTSHQVEEYADKANVSVEWVRRRLESGKMLPSSIYGVPVEDASGKPWGVLVFDSDQPKGIKHRRKAAWAVPVNTVITRILEAS